jgi:hypothetical protein
MMDALENPQSHHAKQYWQAKCSIEVATEFGTKIWPSSNQKNSPSEGIVGILKGTRAEVARLSCQAKKRDFVDAVISDEGSGLKRASKK